MIIGNIFSFAMDILILSKLSFLESFLLQRDSKLPPTASGRDHHGGQPTSRSTELQPAAGSLIEQLGLGVQPRAATGAYTRAVRPSLVPSQGQRRHGQPGEPDWPPGSWKIVDKSYNV